MFVNQFFTNVGMRRVSFIIVLKFQEGQGLRENEQTDKTSRQINQQAPVKKERRMNSGSGKCKPESCWGELKDNERHLKDRTFPVLEEWASRGSVETWKEQTAVWLRRQAFLLA